VLLPVTLAVAAIAWYASGDPVRGLAVLVVATPCPLILAAPVAFIGGVSRAARSGILMKGSAALEALAQARTAIFDKTGTLTHGGAALIGEHAAQGVDTAQTLRLLASLEQGSHHVVADSIVQIARNRGLALSQPHDVREHRGSGIEGRVDGRTIIAGSRTLLLGGNEAPRWVDGGIDCFRQMQVLQVYVKVDGRLCAVYTFGDELRADAQQVIASLRSAGIGRIVMLTGDDAAAARHVGGLLRLDEVIAEATPASKVAVVEAETGRAVTLMVGDGINDAPALATASVGIAMGARGATASSEAADVVILPDRLAPVAQAVSIALRTRKIAMQSIIAGLALSAIGMIFAAFGQITPVAGALLQEVIDVAVILNALRALGEGKASWTR
jgi:heavy metal translocating P-type ATPase